MTDAEELAVIEPSVDVVRNDRGQFAPGHGGTRKGSLNRVTKAMQEQLAVEMEAGGPRSNPLVILLRIATNEGYHPSVRLQAADRLARYLAPRLMTIEMDAPDQQFEVETQKMRVMLRSLITEDRPS